MHLGYTVQASDFNSACQKTVKKKTSKVGIKIWVGRVRGNIDLFVVVKMLKMTCLLLHHIYDNLL